MRVLLVEDSEINRRIIREMLAAGGIDMAEAVDGREGLKNSGFVAWSPTRFDPDQAEAGLFRQFMRNSI